MRILCLVCGHAGHLDFGGSGFLTLATELENRGHTLHWLTPKENAKRLKAKGFKSATSDAVGDLFLLPFSDVRKIKAAKNEFNEKILCIRSLINTAKKYDLIICDRLLALGQLLADKVGKPYVVVGSPSTYFKLGSKFPEESQGPLQSYLEVGEKFLKELGLKENRINSFWARSDLLNICFTGKNFYKFSEPENSAFIYHFEEGISKNNKKGPIGFSFGNTGEPTKLIKLISAFIDRYGNDYKIEIYAGREDQLLNEIYNKFGQVAKVFGWVNFRERFSTLSALVCYGGIGTLWEASNCGVPLATLPDIGDQMINSNAIERLGIGFKLDHLNPASDENLEKLNQLLTNEQFLINARSYRDINNYSDTLHSCCDRIETLII